jgi:hypothetical protein
MPYGKDDWLVENERKHRLDKARVARENEKALRARLRQEFNVPAEFEDLAVRIWWDGKED